MWRKGGRFLVGAFAVVSLTFLGIAVMAIPSTPEGACLNKYGRDPQAVCPTYSGQQCWCDTNAPSRSGYCCGTVTVHVRSFAAFTLVLAKCILASYPTALVVVMLDARTRTDLGVGNFPILPLGSV